MSFELKGTVTNRNHKSAGMVIIDHGKVALQRNGNGREKRYKIPSETQHSTESPEMVSERGAMEECGLLIEFIDYAGTLPSTFTRKEIPGVLMRKSTDYYLLNKKGDATLSPGEKEKMEIIDWFSFKKAIALLKRQKSEEAEVLEEAFKFLKVTR